MKKEKNKITPTQDTKSTENIVEVEEVKEVEPKRKKRNKRYFLLYVAIFGFVIYAAYMLINQNITISEKKTQLAELNKKIEVCEINNDYLTQVKNYTGKEKDEYIEKIAREDLDYIKNGERVFYNISGD